MQQVQRRKTTPTAAQDPATEERSRVVRITGISDKTTRDALLNFFENKRRSEGGEIEDIKYIPEEGLADITFRSAEDAERVSQKENLMFDSAQLKLTLMELPKVLPRDDYKLHVMGISDTTTKDGLWSFLEVVSGKEVRDIFFGSNFNAIVTFEEPPDLEKIKQKCSTRALNGSHVIIEQVSICYCIEVTGLGPKTTRDTVMYYFENPRQSGGGDVKNVEYVDEETTALVFFEEPSVVDNVVHRQHVINGAPVKVAPHYPFLGKISENPGSGKKEKQLKVDLETKVTQATDLSKPHFDLLGFMGFTENINKQFKDLEAWLMEKELKIYFRGPDQVVKEANIAVWKTLVKLKEHEMKLPQSVAIILASDAGDSFLSKVFKSEHINAVVTLEGCDDTKLLVTAIDRKDVNKAMELIEKVSAEESVHLEQDQKSLTLSEKWKKLMTTFQKSMLLKVTIELTSSTVLIAGIKEEVDKAKREIETFFEENLIITKLLETDAGRKKILLRYESVAIKNIEESLKDESVKITLDDNEEGISIRGTREGTDNAFKEVQKLIDQVKERSIDLDKPEMKKLFSESKGMKLLSIVENDHNCIIEQFNQDGRVWYTVFASSDKQLDKADRAIKELISENSKKKSVDNPAIRELSQAQEDRIARLEAKHSTEIVIEKGVGRIVISGVSDDVAEAMKDVYEIILKDQAEMTRKFVELVSKYVQWFYVKDGCETSYDVETNAKIEHAFMNKEDMIKFTMFNDDGKQQHYKIAFGNMTKTNMDSLVEAHVVRKVHDIVVDNVVHRKHVINGATVKVAPHYPFLGEISENPGDGEKETQQVDPQTMAFIFDQEFQNLLQATQINCTWEVGSEDVVLSSVDNKIEKTKWEDSCRTVEDYIHQIITRKIEVSQETFKKLKWQSREICASFKGRVDIECKEKKCLIILRGKKQYVEPLAEQLDDLSEEINKKLEFEKAKITNTLVLTEPQFDLLIFMGFAENLKKQFKYLEATMVKKELKIVFRGPDQVVREGNTAVWQTLAKLKEHDMELPKSIVSILTSDEGNIFLSSQFKRNQIDAVVSFEASDNTKVLVTATDREDTKKAMQLIEQATAEEYVHLEQDQKWLTLSEKWKRLVDSFQKSMLLKVTTEVASNTVWIAGIKDEVDKAKPQIVTFFEKNSIINKFVETNVGRKKVLLRYKSVAIKNIEESLKDQSVHITLDDNEEGISILGTREGTQKAVQKVQNLVDQVKERSINLDKPGMKKLFSENKGMKLLCIVENDHNCIIERCTPAVYISKKGSPLVGNPHGIMWLTVFASSDTQLDKADRAIKELISEHSKKKSIDNPAIRELSQAQEDRIARLQAKHSTEIVVQKRFDRIVISGVSDDVSEAVMEVYDILKELAEEKHIRKFAELVAKTIQWYYMEDGDEEVSYDDEINAKIEQAFMDKKKSIELNIAVDEYGKQQPYKIDFGSMTETNLATRNVARVVRKELGTGIPLPSHWEPQPKDANGKEKDVHLVPLDSVKQKQEYDEVNNAITKTTAINIVKIERVQNPELYRAYMLKKQKMDDKNGSNENKLFHGTPVNTCMLINHKGFNTSYCSKNVILYGKGVYFAGDATFSMRPTYSYSMRLQYSPPDASGKRCMYLARVLVGDYAQGSQSIIAPPQKDPTNPTITYDSTVDDVNNPTIFVAFHDNQVYPDYLITFQ